jgi:hypothetical protein
MNGLLQIKKDILFFIQDIRWKLYYSKQQRIINKQKDIAYDILQKLKVFDNNIVLAGGAVRDWYNNKPADDLDIYIQYFDVDKVIEGLPYLGLKLHMVKTSSLLDNYEKAWYLTDVLEIMYQNQKIQLMIVGVPTEGILKEFPINITRATMDKDRNFYYSKEFLLGFKEKTIENILDYRYNNDHKYIQKIKSKFPDWNYLNKYELQITYN